ncbi:MAG: carbohydrate ABC transporter permease [Chloroflexota bacterium]|nr:carbohydrate ABC transporter permease [Chloroflexota bacterium]
MITSVSPRRRLNNALTNGLAWLVLIALALPALWIVLTAFRPNSEINASPPVWIPQEFTLDAFATMFGLNPDVRQRVAVERYLFNSLVVSLSSTVVAVFVGTLAGYVFSRFKFRFHTLAFLLLMFSRSVPGVALSLPLFLLFTKLGLVNNLFGLAFVYVAINIPFTVWLMDGFFRQIPYDLTEAAYIDGCGYWSAFWRVDLPLSLPGLTTAAIFAFLASWNEFQIASVLTRSNDARTFPPGLFVFTEQFTVDWRGMCAMSVIMMVPAIVFVILTQRNLVRGLTFGAIKG